MPLVKTECKITEVLLNPEQKKAWVDNLLRINGFPPVQEDRDAIYCALPLSNAPAELRPIIAADHDLIKAAIAKANLHIYDPKDDGFNPWGYITDRPTAIYDKDTRQVVIPKFFEFTNLFASSGAGMEHEKALNFVKIAVVINKAGLYTSRMNNGARRTIVLEYTDLVAQQDEIAEVFKTLKRFEPGVGTCTEHGNTLLGFEVRSPPVCLIGLIETEFPGLRYDFDKYMTK